MSVRIIEAPQNAWIALEGVSFGYLAEARNGALRFESMKSPELSGWYPSREAIFEAIRATYSADQIRAWREEAEERRRREEAYRLMQEETLREEARQFHERYPNYGSRFDPSLTTRDIAALIRQRIREAVKAGDLPTPSDYRVTAGKDKITISTLHFAVHYSGRRFLSLREMAQDYQQPSPSRDEKPRPLFEIKLKGGDPLDCKEVDAFWRARAADGGFDFEDMMAYADQRLVERMRRAGFDEDQIERRERCTEGGAQ